jgi:transposase InsO family protein
MLHPNSRKWLFLTTQHTPNLFFSHDVVIQTTRRDRLRRQATMIGLSRAAKLRLEWILHYEATGRQATFTARHFGIARKTFYHWHQRFDDRQLRSLEDHSRRPVHRRQRTYTALQYERVILLRKAHLRYGKMKLWVLYRQQYPQDTTISTWKIQCIVQRSGLYYHPKRQQRINRKRVRSVKRKQITMLQRKPVRGFLLCLDTIVRYHQSQKRYIVTAIDKYSKLAYARMYASHSSRATQDFLYRLHYLLDGKIQNIQTDNGSEFKKHFDATLAHWNIPHYHSRIKTPKDNPDNERFNRTLEEEFIQLGNMTTDLTEFNRRLTDWLIEYNAKRPHQTLGYSTPLNFHYKYHKVLPMYPSSTGVCTR